MEKIIDMIINEMKRSDSLTDDEEIVHCGLKIMIMKSFFAAIIIILGLLFGCFFESVVFTISFVLLRQYSGGYHADKNTKCFVLSTLTLIAALSIIKLIKVYPKSIFPVCIITIVSILYIFAVAPIDTPNKRLDKDEMRVYGKKAKIITAALVTAASVLFILKLNSFAGAIMTGIIVSAYLMLKGQISNYINKEKI